MGTTKSNISMNYWMGIDVSRATLEVALLDDRGERVDTASVKNDHKAVRSLLKRWTKQVGMANEQLLVCLEPTSHYSNGLLRWLVEAGVRVWLAHPSDIQHSVGSTRGKNDRVDAVRIADYARRFQDKASLFTAERLKYTGLRQLITRRKQLVHDRVKHHKQMTDLNRCVEGHLQAVFARLDRRQIRLLDELIAQVDGMILDTIKNDPELHRLYRLIITVPGVGPVLAANLLAITEGFTRFRKARALSCHAGAAPYEHASGTSIRGRTRVSPKANQGLKALLHISALGTIQQEGELREYWIRKIAEGKHKMSILNAIRNKIIHRVCAVVDRGTPYLAQNPLLMS